MCSFWRFVNVDRPLGIYIPWHLFVYRRPAFGSLTGHTLSSKNYHLSTQNRASHAMRRSATLASFGVHRQLAQRALRWQRIVHAAADLGCARTVVSADLRAFAAQQFAGMLPSSDLLFAFPVKSRLVSIPCGHIELRDWVNPLAAKCATHSSFGLCGLAHGELKRRSRCCKKRAFRSLNREGALCWSDSFFELKQFQYTLLATLADKRANLRRALCL